MDNISLKRTATSLFYAVEARSDIGGREQQEDQAYIHIGERQLFLAVCDGMGGALDGAVASLAATATLAYTYTNYCDRGEMTPSEFLYHAMIEADRAVAAKMVHGVGGTTLVAAILLERQMYWVSVGDSRLYIIRSGEIVQATRDHNYRLRLDEMLESGTIDSEVYEREATRGEALLSYLGKGNITLYDLTQTAFALQSGDTIILTTDGLPKAVSHEEICKIISTEVPISQKADALIQCIQNKGKERPQDNSTFVLIHVL